MAERVTKLINGKRVELKDKELTEFLAFSDRDWETLPLE